MELAYSCRDRNDCPYHVFYHGTIIQRSVIYILPEETAFHFLWKVEHTWVTWQLRMQYSDSVCIEQTLHENFQKSCRIVRLHYVKHIETIWQEYGGGTSTLQSMRPSCRGYCLIFTPATATQKDLQPDFGLWLTKEAVIHLLKLGYDLVGG